MRRTTKPARGMTVLELLVALLIMALSIALIYRSVGGSVRGVHNIDVQQGAALLAESLLDSFSMVDANGLRAEGEDGEWRWRAESTPFAVSDLPQSAVPLHALHIVIERGPQRWQFDTLRPERPEQPGESRR